MVVYTVAEDLYRGISRVSVEGELDSSVSDSFEFTVLDAAARTGSCVIVDLTRVTHVESQPMGRLVKSHVILEQQGGDLAIVCASGNVSRVIRTFGFDYMLAVFDDADGAAEYLHPLLEQHD